jgi:hypothetical protein
LARDILARHPIPPRNVVGHADVAPTRKQDPGELFPWHRLSQARIGLWPDEAGPIAEVDVVAALADFGYETTDLHDTLIAFQRHFRPRVVDGVADAETRAHLGSLLRHTPGKVPQKANRPSMLRRRRARVKGCGKSAPRSRRRGRHGKPHREQDQIGAACRSCPVTDVIDRRVFEPPPGSVARGAR